MDERDGSVDGGEVTSLLRRFGEGDPRAMDQLLPFLYQELHSLARNAMRGRSVHRTLQPTALVHEAYLRLVGTESKDWESRRHFLSVASMAMRQLLTDYARSRDAQKRGGDHERVELGTSEQPASGNQELDLSALDDALARLQKLNPRQARIVELRYLTGLSLEETAQVLEVSTRTVSLDWQMAKAWLQRELEAGAT